MERVAGKSSSFVKISSESIAKIALIAATEVNGVALGKKTCNIEYKGKVKIRSKAESVALDLPVYVIKGHNAVTVATRVQKAVKQAVQSMTGITVSEVNINILGAVNEVGAA